MIRTVAVMAGLIAIFTVLAAVGLWPENPQDRTLLAATAVAFAMMALAQHRRSGGGG